MSGFFSWIADRWVNRSAMPDPEASRAVEGLSPTVVVTGASRGIGRAFAARFARGGRDVALIARDAASLDTAAQDIAREANVRAVPLTLDITDVGAPARLDALLRQAGLYCDVLVNNAGIGLAGPFTSHTREDLDRLIALNIAAATRLMQHVLPPMVGRARGGILNVGSLGGLVPGPYQAAYYASKAYLVSLTEAVGYETRGRGVRISVIVPGPVETGFHHDMRAETALYRTILPALSAEAVASQGFRGYSLGHRVIVPGILPAASALALKLLPHALSVPIVGQLLSVSGPHDQ